MATKTHLSVTEAASRLGMTPRGVRYHIGMGNLRAHRVGERVWVLRLKDLLAFEKKLAPLWRERRKKGV